MDSRDLFEILSEIDQDTLQDQDIDSDDLNLQEKRYKNERYRDDTKNRSKLTTWASWVVSIYLGVVLLILIFNHHCICLSDTVLSVLLGTTTLNVLGLMYIVLKGYFQEK